MIKWWEDYRQIKWSFIKELYGKERRPCTKKVEKAEGFSYWTIMCGKNMKYEEEEASKIWDHILTPDRTDQSLKEIFTKPGQSAIYQYTTWWMGSGADARVRSFSG